MVRTKLDKAGQRAYREALNARRIIARQAKAYGRKRAALVKRLIAIDAKSDAIQQQIKALEYKINGLGFGSDPLDYRFKG